MVSRPAADKMQKVVVLEGSEAKVGASCNEEDIHYLGQAMNGMREATGFGVRCAAVCVTQAGVKHLKEKR